MNELGLQFFSVYHCERRQELCVVVGRQYCILNGQHLGITLQVKKMKRKRKKNRETTSFCTEGEPTSPVVMVTNTGTE